ncbi:MAG: ribonuclease III domain-containing protein [Candidatus Nanopelagicales bacterium]
MTPWRAALRGLEADDVAQLDRALGMALGREDLVRALIDPRGHLFQRLEYVGDSLLDAVVVSELVRLEPWDEPSLALVNGEQQAMVSDHALGRVAARRGLPRVRTFQASKHRLADRIEACIGAIWADRGLADAASAAYDLVVRTALDGLPRIEGVPRAEPAARYEAASRSLGHEPVDLAWFGAAAAGGPARRRLAVVGDSVIEAAMSTAQYVDAPEATEAQMSEERRAATSNATLAVRARDLHLERRGDDRSDRRAMADEVQALVGAAAMDGGLRAGLLVASGVLRRTFAPGPLAFEA